MIPLIEREALADAVRTFGESLKNIDADDLWQNLTQKTAEILRAERASLLIFNENSGGFEIKALIGAKEEPADDEQPGSRVARIVFARREAVIVADVAKPHFVPRVVAISGPTFAPEVARGEPTALVVASPDEDLRLSLQQELSAPRFRLSHRQS